MCPSDTTPDPRDMLRAPDEPEFMQPRPDGVPARDPAQVPDVGGRPSLPEAPTRTAVDIEDEDADPVGSNQPGLAERLQSDSELNRG